MDVRATLGEGPLWVEREKALYWVDIPERTLFRWSEGDGVATHVLAEHLCALAPRAARGFIGAGYEGFVGIGADLQLTGLGNPEPDLAGNRFNDGKVDREGRFWAGTMDRRSGRRAARFIGSTPISPGPASTAAIG